MNDKLKEEIRKTQEILKKGGIILYPTDTIWGLGCDATNTEAVKRIYEIKKRADNKSMLVLLDDAGKIASYADVPAIALDLIEVADKPTTIIYPGAKRLAPDLSPKMVQSVYVSQKKNLQNPCFSDSIALSYPHLPTSAVNLPPGFMRKSVRKSEMLLITSLITGETIIHRLPHPVLSNWD